MDLDTFNDIAVIAGAELVLCKSAGRVASLEFHAGSLAACLDAPLLDVPREFHLIGHSGELETFRARGALVQVRDVLEAIQAHELRTRSADAHPDTRHIYFEGLERVRRHPDRFQIVWGSWRSRADTAAMPTTPRKSKMPPTAARPKQEER